ncbi:hypothetical protein GCM10027404_17270 [Arthrobacter tumbae]|uniref:hypothetical protein n=1 Tax=Arthrobacter tumbae TaxID=163874 RepID=UPI00195DBD5C|nr:hypothetical protein [Arthrobacter tumbae]MBM7780776.1 hypothetical protein [Arthrobacter tumbae]
MSLLTSTEISRIRDVATLRRGDEVEAHLRNEVHYRGRVEDTAPGIGVVWIRDDADGRRAILHTDEYAIWRIRTVPLQPGLAA